MEKEAPSVLYTDTNLPEGWKRNVIERPGKNKSKFEITISNPDGQIFKNVAQLDKYFKSIKSDMKGADFDFTVYGKGTYQRKRKKVIEEDAASGQTNSSFEESDSGRRRSGRLQGRIRSHEDESEDNNSSHLNTSAEATPKKRRSNRSHEVAVKTKDESSVVPTSVTTIVENETIKTTTVITEKSDGTTEIDEVKLTKDDVVVNSVEAKQPTMVALDVDHSNRARSKSPLTESRRSRSKSPEKSSHPITHNKSPSPHRMHDETHSHNSDKTNDNIEIQQRNISVEKTILTSAAETLNPSLTNGVANNESLENNVDIVVSKNITATTIISDISTPLETSSL